MGCWVSERKRVTTRRTRVFRSFCFHPGRNEGVAASCSQHVYTGNAKPYTAPFCQKFPMASMPPLLQHHCRRTLQPHSRDRMGGAKRQGEGGEFQLGSVMVSNMSYAARVQNLVLVVTYLWSTSRGRSTIKGILSQQVWDRKQFFICV